MTVQASIDELGAVISQSAVAYVENLAFLPNYVWRKELAPGTISCKFPSWATSNAASALTDGNEVSPVISTTSGPTLTPSILAAHRELVTDLADFTAGGLAVEIGQKAAIACTKKINSDIWALFAGFSQTAGTTNTDISEAAIRSAVRQLRVAGAPGPYYMAITPEVESDIWALYSTNTNNTAEGIRNSILNNGMLPPIYGVQPLIVSSGIAQNGSGDFVCGVFSPWAIGMASGWLFRTEIQRRASYVGYDVVVSCSYAVGEAVDKFGVALTADGV